jgi:tetratricopeptide (TPR) repeat protein
VTDVRARWIGVALLLALFAGCRRDAPLPPLTRELLGGDDGAARALRALASGVDARRRAGAGPADAIVATMFGAPGGFAREVDDPSARYVLLPSVLAGHRGGCVGLGTLALSLAELTGARARGVLAANHFYVEIEDGPRWRRVETLKDGLELPDEWYRDRYGTPGRAVTDAEVLGVVAYDVGNARRREGRLVEARQAYERAVRDFPTFAEAHASLGATLQLAGALDEAAAAYARARALDPKLPGLDQNVELLDAERATRGDRRLAPRAP